VLKTITILQNFRLRRAQNEYNPLKAIATLNFFACGALKTITHQPFKISTCGVRTKK
jgi:hypothetical protein